MEANDYDQPRVLDKNGFVLGSNRTVYNLSEDDILIYAKNKDISLTEDDLNVVKKCIDWGLSTGIDTVLDAAIDEAVNLRGGT